MGSLKPSLGFPAGSDSKESVCNAGTWVQSLGLEDPLEKEIATHSSILSWRILWTEEPGGLQSTGSERVGHNWRIHTSFKTLILALGSPSLLSTVQPHAKTFWPYFSQHPPLAPGAFWALPLETEGRNHLCASWNILSVVFGQKQGW